MAVLRLAVVVLAARGVLCPDPALLEEARELSELPLDRLLHIKQAFTAPGPAHAGDEGLPKTATGGVEGPEAMALTGVDKARWSARTAQSGPGQPPSLFQGTVTTLAFLAFGGYILCLAVSAARANNAASSRGLWPTPGGGGEGSRRRRREALPGAEEMLTALGTLAEGYAAYHALPPSQPST